MQRINKLSFLDYYRVTLTIIGIMLIFQGDSQQLKLNNLIKCFNRNVIVLDENILGKFVLKPT